MSNRSSMNRRSQWDVSRFVSTLNTFGEIPFLGSFRWLQQLLGQSPTFKGRAVDTSQRRALLVDSQAIATNVLTQQQQRQPNVVWSATSWQGLLDKCVEARLDLLRSLDTLVLLDLPTDEESDLSFLKVLSSADLTVPVFNFSNQASSAQSEETHGDSSTDVVSAWGSLDDVVMGGVSEGRLLLVDEHQPTQHALFAGQVSTDNSGGFSSVRTRNFEPPFSFSGAKGMRLRVRGDGQRYKFILRNSPGWDSPAYIYSFDTTPQQWVTVHVPFAEMVPTFRAKSLSDAPPFDAEKVFSCQLMLSKFEYDRQLNPAFKAGPFELAIECIDAYRPRQGKPLLGIRADDEMQRRRQQEMLAAAQVDIDWIEAEGIAAAMAG